MSFRVLFLIPALFLLPGAEAFAAETSASAPRKPTVRKKARKRAAKPTATAKPPAPTAKAAPKAAAPVKPQAAKPGKSRSETFVVTPAGSLVRNDAPAAPPSTAAADGFTGFTVDTSSIGQVDASKLGDVR